MTEPPPLMTWSKAMPTIVMSGTFDTVRLFFTFFWFLGPALAALYCTAKASGVLSSWTFGWLGMKTAAIVCSGVAAVVGTAAVEATTPIGVVMAMATGLIGWLVIGMKMVMTNARIFKENLFSFVVSLAVSEVPFVNALPALTFTTWRMYRNQIKVETAAFKKWEKDTADARLRERNEQMAQAAQIQAAQGAISMQQGAANDAAYEQERVEAANDDEYTQRMDKAA